MNYLLSYPRSGSSYVRFLLESITSQRTLDCHAQEDQSQHDFSQRSELIKYSDKDKILTRKAHFPDEFEDADVSKLILILRDPLEAIGSHCLRSNIKPKDGEKIAEQVKLYLSNVHYFHAFERDKHLINYETITTNPLSIDTTLAFLRVDIDLESFRQNIDGITKASRETYHAGAKSPQADIHFYKTTEPALCRAILEMLGADAQHPLLAHYFEDESALAPLADSKGLLGKLFG